MKADQLFIGIKFNRLFNHLRYQRAVIFIAPLLIVLQSQLTLFSIRPSFGILAVYLFTQAISLENTTKNKYLAADTEIKGVIFGVCVGLIEDILTGSLIGPNFFSKGFLGFLCGLIFSGPLFNPTRLMHSLLIVSVTLFDLMITAFLHFSLINTEVALSHLFKTALIQSSLNLALSLILLGLGNSNDR